MRVLPHCKERAKEVSSPLLFIRPGVPDLVQVPHVLGEEIQKRLRSRRRKPSSTTLRDLTAHGGCRRGFLDDERGGG